MLTGESRGLPVSGFPPNDMPTEATPHTRPRWTRALSPSLLIFVSFLWHYPIAALSRELPSHCFQPDGFGKREDLVCSVQVEVFASVGCGGIVFETYVFPWVVQREIVSRTLAVYKDVEKIRVERNSTFSVSGGQWQTVPFTFSGTTLSWMVEVTDEAVAYRVSYRGVLIFGTEQCRLGEGAGKYVALWTPGLIDKNLLDVTVNYHLPKSAQVTDTSYSMNSDDRRTAFEYNVDNSSLTDSCYHSWETPLISRRQVSAHKKVAIVVFNVGSSRYGNCPQLESCKDFDGFRVVALTLMIGLPIVFFVAMAFWWQGRKNARMPHMMWIALMILTLLGLLSGWIGFVQVERGTDIGSVDTLKVRLLVIRVIIIMCLSGALGVLVGWLLCLDVVVTCGGRVEHYAVRFNRDRLGNSGEHGQENHNPIHSRNATRRPEIQVITVYAPDNEDISSDEGPSSR
ncbi:hypothetical protein BSKO_07808 [Bryopsis sp. KO-2023]|nr:hypothetical protein BSKO_07808 [Bryopsis sp. KO-2023]